VIHTDTGRLCSTGSECHPVPRRLRSYAALRLPAPVGRSSGSPCRGLPRCRRLFCAPRRADDTCARKRVVRRRRVTGAPRHRDWSRRGEGLPGSWAILFVRAMVEHPAGDVPLLAQFSQGSLLPSGNSAPWASGKTIGFGAAFPWPTRSRAYASPALFRRLSQGSLPTWAGSPLVGRDLHPLDDAQSFMKASPPPIPFDQQSLVALIFLYSDRCPPCMIL
jgi:hypothetical protein